MEDITYNIVDPGRTCIIERIDAGILFTWFEYSDTDKWFVKRTPFEYVTDDDLKKVIEMLYFMLETMGIFGGIEIELNEDKND